MNPLRPLWQLLLKTAVPRSNSPLSCADCFSILEYLADLGPAPDDWPTLVQRARQHLATCPDCQAYYQARLDALAALNGRDLMIE